MLLVLLVIFVAVILFRTGRGRGAGDDAATDLHRQFAEVFERNTKAVNDQLFNVMGKVNEQLKGVQGLIDKRLEANARAVADRLRENSQTMDRTRENVDRRLEKVTESLMGLESAQEKIFEVGKDILELQDILKAPKLRGGLGEFFLEDFLRQILPPNNFKTQFAFSTGEKVDAVIKLGSGLVPVDSKFPMENFKKYITETGEDKKRLRAVFARDVKKHIDDIKQKYIRPDEGTFEFALMYIPAENIYYETIIRDEDLGGDKSILSYALANRVIPVSPNSFYAYLQAIVMGLKGLQIEESARLMYGHLERLKSDLTRFKEDFDTLGTHLKNARSKYDDAGGKLGKFEDKLVSGPPGGAKAIEED
ncbi:MAG: DNA recombination protein RmuC [Deltaproteobacteria bacterium]|uniref:DNA recombination protein RmuC n=1 Tax=Candidatus Zymogenus saltonus TaxID=2844893 RepID=A0A9D8KJD1_9DELT|nr:DNA recombination protein RmuC [Candidatus Zymogenus saltonus]